MGGTQSNLVNLLPALPGLALGIAMLVLARRGRNAREAAGAEAVEERPSGKVAAALREIGLPENCVIAKEDAHEPQNDTGT